MGAVLAYLLIVVCGTMGSPTPVKISAANCGLYNNCTIAAKEGYDTSAFLLWHPGIEEASNVTKAMTAVEQTRKVDFLN